MDTAQEIIFGESGFPRTVAHASNGHLQQHFIHSKSAFDMFFEHNRPDKNLYSSICRFRSDMRPVNCSIPWDFDSPMKDSVFDDETDREKVELMRTDEELADKILGEVWGDAQSLVKRCKRDNIPAVTVFSGLGVHVHMLYKDRVNPVEEKVSTSNYYIDECDLNTYDRQIITDTRRILRIPNSQRVDDGVSAGVWCIPITEDEVLNNTIHDLLERCASPKDIPFHDRYRKENRPEMETKQGYEDVDGNTTGTEPLRNSVTTELNSGMKEIIKDCIAMPCIKERFFTQNPHHMVRFNGVAFLYQAGFHPEEVREIIRNIGWIDYDEEITYKMTEQIWNRRYSEMKCESIKSLGLCVFGEMFNNYSNNPEDCETYKYTSGEALYPYE
jgi:hypothetical protein